MGVGVGCVLGGNGCLLPLFPVYLVFHTCGARGSVQAVGTWMCCVVHRALFISSQPPDGAFVGREAIALISCPVSRGCSLLHNPAVKSVVVNWLLGGFTPSINTHTPVAFSGPTQQRNKIQV